jgi:hypothetical protein
MSADKPPIFPLAACFQHVYLRKHVNTLFFTSTGCRLLIPQAFPQSYRRLLCSNPPGVTCPPIAHAKHGRHDPACTNLGGKVRNGHS